MGDGVTVPIMCTSDEVPAAYYLVVKQDRGEDKGQEVDAEVDKATYDATRIGDYFDSKAYEDESDGRAAE